VFATIAERDRWRCHLCRKAVSRKLRGTSRPLSPSLDHVVPLSKGGAHDPANVRLAHLRCNLSKGNRGGGEQLSLIG
jgi:5-methylcytosine-specific restriction endonuclease McrA